MADDHWQRLIEHESEQNRTIQRLEAERDEARAQLSLDVETIHDLVAERDEARRVARTLTAFCDEVPWNMTPEFAKAREWAKWRIARKAMEEA